MTHKSEIFLNTCNVMTLLLFTASLVMLIAGVKDNVAIWEGFIVAFLFTYWKNRYRIYIARRERERIGCYESR